MCNFVCPDGRAQNGLTAENTTINATTILLAPFEYYVEHRLAKYGVGSYLGTTVCSDLYYYKPLQKIFSKVIAYDYVRRITEIGVKRINEEIIDLVRREHPRYVIWVSAYYEFRESTFEAIRKDGAVIVGLFFEDDTAFDEYSKWWIPYLDYCVTNCIEAVPKYRNLGARCILANPIVGGIPVNVDWSNVEEKRDVSFVGIKKFDRESYINELKKQGLPLHLFGWSGGTLLSVEDMLDVFRTSKINLNFSKTGQNRMQIKARIFEVCLAGGFLLTEYAPGIENYFEPDKEIVCFRDAEEMINKINYYLSHEEERRTIAQAGWKRAVNEYSSFHVMSKIFGQIEKDIAASSEEDKPYSEELRMPIQIRERFSKYYLKWGVAFLVENRKKNRKLWKDAFDLSLLYDPVNIRAWYCYLIGFVPSTLRPCLAKLCRTLRPMVGSVPYRRKMKQVFVKGLYNLMIALGIVRSYG